MIEGGVLARHRRRRFAARHRPVSSGGETGAGIVRVPASANLGPGYDVLAAAVAIELELEVEETGTYGFDPGGLEVPTGRENLLVSSFERLHSADGISFRQRSEIPLARGLGSSAAAIVAGLVAADHLFELGHSREALFELACEIEGHPDNVAAALFGGLTIVVRKGDRLLTKKILVPDVHVALAVPDLSFSTRTADLAPMIIAPPEGVEAILVILVEEVSTADARAAMGAEALLDFRRRGVHNVAGRRQPGAGSSVADLTLIERKPSDCIHQDRCAPLSRVDRRCRGELGRSSTIPAPGRRS